MPEAKKKLPNPIAFNPDTMTVSQLKECAETLRTLFQAMDHDNPPENITGQLEYVRERMIQRWGVPA